MGGEAGVRGQGVREEAALLEGLLEDGWIDLGTGTNGVTWVKIAQLGNENKQLATFSKRRRRYLQGDVVDVAGVDPRDLDVGAHQVS